MTAARHYLQLSLQRVVRLRTRFKSPLVVRNRNPGECSSLSLPPVVLYAAIALAFQTPFRPGL